MKKLAPLTLLLLLAACGGQQQAPAAPEASAPAAQQAPAQNAAAPAADPKLAHGEDVVKKTCLMCHQTGAAGAPIVGNAADWGPRVAKGKEQLYQHAIAGFTGDKGMMPAKGGNATLSDDDVKAAVDFLVSKVPG